MNKKKFNILVACEESQVVTIAFRERGFKAYSCDLQEPSGKHLEWHVKDDVIKLLNTPVNFRTMDNKRHRVENWSLIIAHPPCTYISKAGAVWMFKNKKLNQERYEKMLEACQFFKKFLESSVPLVCVENPVPLKIAPIPRPTTYIEPYWFGESYSKKTCLWLKNLPPLFPTIIQGQHKPWVNGGNHHHKYSLGKHRNSKMRSKTFVKVAEQFSRQYGDFMIKFYQDKL